MLAEQIGDAGAGRLKQLATEAVNERFAPFRARRRLLAEDPGTVRQVLARGNAQANDQADCTLAQVRTAMGMDY
ncbi:hypothetical protein GCM10009569_23660 [Arthrobacter russicus]|uniref:Tryptophan--tRNA ligase n=1 Tax=Arthrobacter russicus TaxID=172040 RepID=A0ABU1J6T6_9MICC|nr:hypothetical protein [Arthrobacter russicus]